MSNRQSTSRGSGIPMALPLGASYMALPFEEEFRTPKVPTTYHPVYQGERRKLGGFALGQPAISVKSQKADANEVRGRARMGLTSMQRGHDAAEMTREEWEKELPNRLHDPRYLLHGTQVDMRTRPPVQINEPAAPSLNIDQGYEERPVDVLKKAKKQFKAKTNPSQLDKAKEALRSRLKGKGRRRE